jgi:membrane protein DedA with SNARE-associated domain
MAVVTFAALPLGFAVWAIVCGLLGWSSTTAIETISSLVFGVAVMLGLAAGMSVRARVAGLRRDAAHTNSYHSP